MNLDIGSTFRPCAGETVCGDQLRIISNNTTTMALADGLGHGPKANHAAGEFIEYIENHLSDDLETMIRDASKHIAKTRGVAGAIVRIDTVKQLMWFAGIGNIELVAESVQPIHAVCTPGIIGRPLRKIIVFEYNVEIGDLFALYTDGISTRFKLASFAHMDVQEIAEAILTDFGKSHDDATCIVARCVS